jgi:hypothetical protein
MRKPTKATGNPLVNYTQRRAIDYSSKVMAQPETFLTTTGDIVAHRGPTPTKEDLGKTIICTSKHGGRGGKGKPGVVSPTTPAALYGMRLQVVVTKVCGSSPRAGNRVPFARTGSLSVLACA